MTSLPLKHIQANILKGHGRKHAWLLFLRFGISQLESKHWIGGFSYKVTSAEKQMEDTRLFKNGSQYKTDAPGSMVVCFFLSPAGYRNLGWRYSMPQDKAFQGGMAGAGPRLNDPGLAKWEKRYSGNLHDMHAMILLADDSKKKLKQETEEIKRSLNASQAGEVLFVEKGRKLQYGSLPVEHFGYVDGLSQPDLSGEDGGPDEDKCKEVVFDDELGSYLVFRKLEQNVEAFNRQVRELAKALEVSEDVAGAQIIGRFKNGMPLTISGNPTINNPGDHYKGFSLHSDLDGRRCPLHAHIRKAGPSNGDVGNKGIVRRGIPYGKRKPGMSDEPRNGVGLLFMCYQKSIGGQFEPIQTNCNSQDSPAAGPSIGKDPLIGQTNNNGPENPLPWNKAWDQAGSGHKAPFPFKTAVKLRGGQYFYAPTITFLKSLTPQYGRGDYGRGNRSILYL